MPTLYRSQHFVLEHHLASGYVRLSRSEAPLPTPAFARAELQACAASLANIDASGLGILLDWRKAAISSDPALIQALLDGTQAFTRNFARRAILLATPVGKLQATRLGRMQTVAPLPFDDEENALKYVIHGSP